MKVGVYEIPYGFNNYLNGLSQFRSVSVVCVNADFISVMIFNAYQSTVTHEKRANYEGIPRSNVIKVLLN